MKSLLKYVAMACVAISFTACVQDLNTVPIDKNSTTGFNQDALFTKIYATLGTTGQTGAAGSGDIDDIDEGWSGLFRVTWVLNGFPSEEGWWIWNDVGVDQTRVMTWDGENPLVKCLYFRCMTDAKYCNHFLAMAENASVKDQQQRAEVRFIRALNYWYLLDMYKFAPFMSKESTDPNNYPDFKTRPELYRWLVDELLVLAGEKGDPIEALPAHRLGKYRVDQAAAWLLLARMYLNSGVYNELDEPTELNLDSAIWAADKALSYGYTLHTTERYAKVDSTRFSAYQQLFMGDNDVNGAQNEAVLMVYQDGKYCRSYGGVQYAIAATRDGGMVPWGVSENWKCFRSSPEFVYKFVDKDKTSKIKANEYEMPILLGDDRAILCSFVKGNSNRWTLTGGKKADFYASWACPKFTAVYSTSDSIKHALNSDSNWPDTDIPLMRIAEAYMTKAEAMWRKGDKAGATDLINTTIRARANAQAFPEPMTESELCDEWCREFWGEGRRRIDLIRFHRFAGAKADASGYTWEGRPSKTEEKLNWYPVPSDDKRTNPNFKKQVMDKSGALEGGDGYTFAN